MSTTIAAIGTALSNSGISIIRISGKDSLNIINKIFITLILYRVLEGNTRKRVDRSSKIAFKRRFNFMLFKM